MSLWIPFTNRGILGGSVWLYLPMPLVVWVKIMDVKQDKKKSGKNIQLLWVNISNAIKQKKLIKRALPSLRSVTEQVSNLLTQWSLCCVCFFYQTVVLIDNSQTWIYECATTIWPWCDTLNFVFMQLQKSRHILYSIYSPLKIINTLFATSSV